MKIVLKGGHVIDPSQGIDGMMDVLIRDDRIEKLAPEISEAADETVDVSGCLVVPGLIDMHVHLREPGFEHKETIKTGSMAAARGGFTSICPMPNTKPVIDSPEMVRWVLEKAEKEAVVHILPVGAVTKGQMGSETADITGMAKAGAVAISEDGKSVMNTEVYRQGMVLAKEAGIPVLAHCEDRYLVKDGALNAGPAAQKIGVTGIDNAVEDIIASRDILLSKETGCRLHLCHCSTKDSVRMVKEARADGLAVSGEVCPHHFTLTQDDIPGDDANYKMNPPLRSQADKAALVDGLCSDVMEVISTDHAPHHADEKAKGIAKAPFGIVGLETSVALTMTELVHTGKMTPVQMVEHMSTAPARILGIDKGSLKPGKMADITIIDPEAEYEICAADFVSKGKNTPFDGKKVKGRVTHTFVAGKCVYKYKKMEEDRR